MTSGDGGRQAGLWGVVRKTLLLLVGGALTLAGVVLLVVPGPGIPLILAGLAVLSPEFPWARRQRNRLRNAARLVWQRGRTEIEDPPEQSEL